MLLWPGRPKHNDPKNKPHNRDHSHGRNQNDEAAIHAFGFFVFFKRLPIDVLVRGRRDCGIGLRRYLFEWGDNDGFLHFGHAPFLPPCLSGTLILWPQLPQGNSMMVDLSGTTTPLPHFGHLPFLPECFSSTLMSRRQFEQANLIMVFSFSSPLAQETCPRGHKVSPSFSPF